MNPSENPHTQSCKNCPASIAPGYLGLESGMCIVCVRASLIQSKNSLSHEQDPDISAPEAKQAGDWQCVQGAEDRIAGDKAGDIKAIGVESKSTWSSCAQGDQNFPVACIEESTKPPNDRKRRPRTAGRNSDGFKLTPVCANCKRAKIRCTHRRVITEDSGTSFETRVEAQTPPRTERKTVRLKLNPPRTEGKSNTNSPPSQRQTRGINRKRKSEEIEDASQDIFEIPVRETGAGDIREASQQPSPKRSRRGRKPNSERSVTVEVEESFDTARVPTVESSTIDNTPPAPPSFPADSMQGAALLSRHVVLSRELQQRLEDCDSKWIAAIESLHEAKRTLDTWVGVWRSGR